MTLETGIRGEQSVLVTAANTAKTMGSGTLEVFATPALVALAEKTCWMSVADALGEGNGFLFQQAALAAQRAVLVDGYHGQLVLHSQIRSRFFDRGDHFHRIAGAVFKAAAVLIGAVVQQGGTQ